MGTHIAGRDSHARGSCAPRRSSTDRRSGSVVPLGISEGLRGVAAAVQIGDWTPPGLGDPNVLAASEHAHRLRCASTVVSACAPPAKGPVRNQAVGVECPCCTERKVPAEARLAVRSTNSSVRRTDPGRYVFHCASQRLREYHPAREDDEPIVPSGLHRFTPLTYGFDLSISTPTSVVRSSPLLNVVSQPELMVRRLVASQSF